MQLFIYIVYIAEAVLAVDTANVVLLLACYPLFSWELLSLGALILIALTKLPVPSTWEQLRVQGEAVFSPQDL